MKNRILMLIALTLLALGLCACARADVVFSEVMASTATSKATPPVVAEAIA